MFRFDAWNITVLNSSTKQKEIKNYIISSNMVLVAVLKTKVREANIEKMSKNCFGDWTFVNNNDLNHKGGIWVA